MLLSPAVDARAAAIALRRRAPGPAKEAARRVAEVVDPVRVSRFRRREQVSLPIPPRRLRTRIGSITPADYVANGRDVAERIERAAGHAGVSLAQVTSALDFGCGTGRVVHHVVERLAPGAAVHAVDVDGASIAWAAQDPGAVRFAQCRYDPPLEFEDATFDLVYAISVFTHLDRDKEAAWLGELRRVLKPGGLGVITVLGGALLERVRTSGDVLGVTQHMVDTARALGPLEEEGLVFLPYVRRGTAAQGSPDMGDDDYGLTFHGERYLRDAWSRDFEVLARFPRSINVHQDAILVRPRTAPGGP